MTRLPDWLSKIEKRETAQNIFDRTMLVFQKDVAKGNIRNRYSIREFSQDESIDANGNEVPSPVFTILFSSLSDTIELIVKAKKDIKKTKKLDKTKSDKTKDLIENKKKIRRRSRKKDEEEKLSSGELLARTFNTYYNTIEKTLGAPNLISKYEINEKLMSSLRTVIEIKEQLDRFKKREKFELKLLREICPTIKSTQNYSTKSALKILSWLYNNGDGQKLDLIIEKLWESLYDREKDRLFYIRRHPKQRVLHFCSDDVILETVKHLEWMFISGNPFRNIRRINGALARLT